MLVLKRKLNESVMIGDNIEVTILSLDKDGIRIGIQAPKDVSIYRKEIYLAIQEENQNAGKVDKDKFNELSQLFKDLPR